MAPQTAWTNRVSEVDGGEAEEGCTSDPSVLLQPRQAEVQDLSSDIIEIHIEVPDRLLEVLAERLALVVERGVDSELVDKELALVGTAGEGDDSAAFEFGDLADLRNGES